MALGELLGPLGAPLGPLGVFVLCCFVSLEASWGLLGTLGPRGAHLGRPWELLGTSWGRLGQSGRILGSSWALFGWPGAALGDLGLPFSSASLGPTVPGLTLIPCFPIKPIWKTAPPPGLKIAKTDSRHSLPGH